jgi:hypothetical protein
MPNKDVDRPPDVECLLVGRTTTASKRSSSLSLMTPKRSPRMDDYEVVVDGFQRLSVLGLEVMTLDGPLRARIVRNLEGERQRDHRPG